MTFPLHAGTRRVDSPLELGLLVRADCRLGGTVVAGLRPWQWVVQLVLGGSLEPAMARALAAGLVRMPEAPCVAEGARLAAALGDRAIGDLLVSALRAHDPGLLLEPDPADPVHSVEDAILRAVTTLCDLGDPVLRHEVLERLRHAALPAEEVAVLCRWGDDAELDLWLPAVRAEGIPANLQEAVAGRLAERGRAR